MSLEYDTYFLPDNLAVSVNWGLFCGCPWNTIPTFLPDNLAVSVNWGLVCGCPWNTIPTFLPDNLAVSVNWWLFLWVSLEYDTYLFT